MISDNIHALLLLRGLNLDQLASLSQVPLETIRNILYKKATNPRINTLTSLARALNVSLDTLVFGGGGFPDSRHYNSHGEALLSLISEIESEIFFQQHYLYNHYTIPCIHTDCTFTGTIPYIACSFLKYTCAEPNAFLALKVSGNYYSPRFFPGDILLFENRFPNNGEIALFYHLQHLYLRIYQGYAEGFHLRSVCGRDPEITPEHMNDFLLIGTYCGTSRI